VPVVSIEARKLARDFVPTHRRLTFAGVERHATLDIPGVRTRLRVENEVAS